MVTEFAEFVRAVHGHAPFPWQVRAAEALCSGDIPEAICLPTGSGKTSILDAALFSMSRGAGLRRVVYTVDRRLVVDGVSAHAERLAEALAGAEHPTVKRVAKALGHPLRVVRLRGGVPLDDEWVLYPEEPCIMITTVDQAGSRLLFRGYGVSPRQAPIHAALLGYGALHVVDEAHLSAAYLKTLKSCRTHGANIHVIEMTATPAADVARVLALDESDRTHPVLSIRLNAKKHAGLVATTAAKLTGSLVSEALAMRKAGSSVIGVVVNTVGRAREVYEGLHAHGEAVLLTGRVRPFERDRLVEALMPSICAGRDRKAGRPLFVVGTQTVEVGADLDFDALVTECASISALRQRFGRLDRLGVAGTSHAAIVYAAKSDKVYGASYDEAWKWMRSVAVESALDFGIEALAAHPTPPAEPSLPVPPLARSHLELLAVTGIAAPPIDIRPWLHGVERPSADVSIVWRADLDAERPEEWGQIVSLLPPMSAEALAIPIHAARIWLQTREVSEVADIEIGPLATTRNGTSRKALRWDGELGELVEARTLRPGDTLVVPATYGGCDEMGWSPTYDEAVQDLAEAVRDAAGRPKRTRIHPALATSEELLAAAQRWAGLMARPAEEEVDSEEVEHELSIAENDLIERLAADGPLALDRYPRGEGVVARRIGPEFGQLLQTGVAVALDEHLAGVSEWSGRIAETLGADRDLLEAAGRLHDEGKRVAAFQTMLHGSPIHSQPLAKSGLTGSAASAAWSQSALPRGFRHEAASVALTGGEDALLRHLVGAHHGYGRPWFPLCDDPTMPGSELARIDGDWLAQFAALQRTHGPWGLAWLEMILRAGDARRSIEEQQ